MNVALRASSNWTSLTTYEALSSFLSTQSVWAVSMCFFGVTDRYNGPPEAAHAHICDTRDNIVECGAAGQLKLKLVLSYHLRSCNIISINAIRLSSAICFFGVTDKHNGSLEAASANIDDDRDDIVECGAAGQLKLVLSYHLRSCNIISINAIFLSSANVLLRCRRQV